MPTTTIPHTGFRTIGGVRIRYADSGGSAGSAQKPAVVLTSPWPESVYAFASMWSSLSEHARLFAVDVGTSAALFAAAAHPERIASVVVGTGGAAVPIQLGEPLASWVLDPDLDKYRKMDPRVIVNTTMDTIAGGIPDDIRADYLACYDGDRFAESMRYVRKYPEELPVLAGLLPQITVPVTIINGRHDRVVPLANAEFLDQRLPSSRLVIIDAGHFVWEEEPVKYAAAVTDSITGNGP
jgi:pimeloyl-ACP methyl ester carboxylesterase